MRKYFRRKLHLLALTLPAKILTSIAAAALIIGCDSNERQSKSYSEVVTYSETSPDKARQQQFKDALNKAAVPYETYRDEKGNERLKWQGENNDAVERVRISLFGPLPPAGRSIGFDARYQDQFKKFLDSNRIPYKTAMSYGKEYVIWEAHDYARIASWEHFPRESFEKQQMIKDPLPTNPNLPSSAPY